MIRSLDDAWRWHQAVRKLVWMMDRIAKRYWDEEKAERTLGETLHRDDRLKEYESVEIQDMARTIMEDLDALAVLLFFSVFEAIVRDRILEEMDIEMSSPPRHPALLRAVADARDAIEHGSFGRLTEAYKDPKNPEVTELVTLVDQVRHYRNWVAHGRRRNPKNNVEPDAARERLARFLGLLDVAATSVTPPTRDESTPETPGSQAS